MKFPRTINLPTAAIAARTRRRNYAANPPNQRSSRVIKSAREIAEKKLRFIPFLPWQLCYVCDSTDSDRWRRYSRCRNRQLDPFRRIRCKRCSIIARKFIYTVVFDYFDVNRRDRSTRYSTERRSVRTVMRERAYEFLTLIIFYRMFARKLQKKKKKKEKIGMCVVL